jgi:hypothetical protein
VSEFLNLHTLFAFVLGVLLSAMVKSAFSQLKSKAGV